MLLLCHHERLLVNLPLLAEFGHLSLHLAISGSAEPAATATEVVVMATDPPEDPLPPLLESPVLEDDAIHVDDNQSTPAPAEMVEWVYTYSLNGHGITCDPNPNLGVYSTIHPHFIYWVI